MLVEDHLRLQSKLSCASRMKDVAPSPLTLAAPATNRSSSIVPGGGEPSESPGDRRSLSSDSGGHPLGVCIWLFYRFYVLKISFIFNIVLSNECF